MATAPQPTAPQSITSRDNPLLVRLRKLAQEPSAYRKLGSLWIEGQHLCEACLARGRQPVQAVISESGWRNPALRRVAEAAPRIALLPDALFAPCSGLESPGQVGLLLDHLDATLPIEPGLASVVLDRLQDAGNVGSILRTAAAFGFGQIVALKGTAALWSPKVLRAGMGAHFSLRLVEAATPESLAALGLPLIATSSHAERALSDPGLPWPCAWVLGHEGQGVDAQLLSMCQDTRRIPQPGGEESLNVGAAAAICLYESTRGR